MQVWLVTESTSAGVSNRVYERSILSEEAYL